MKKNTTTFDKIENEMKMWNLESRLIGKLMPAKLMEGAPHMGTWTHPNKYFSIIIISIIIKFIIFTWQPGVWTQPNLYFLHRARLSRITFLDDFRKPPIHSWYLLLILLRRNLTIYSRCPLPIITSVPEQRVGVGANYRILHIASNWSQPRKFGHFHPKLEIWHFLPPSPLKFFWKWMFTTYRRHTGSGPRIPAK